MSAKLTVMLGEMASSPMLAVGVTLLSYVLADRLYRRCRMHPLLNPVPLSAAVVIVLLQLTGWSYQSYFEGAQYIHLLLGPAVVALAVPLYRVLPLLRQLALPLAVGAICGSLTAITSAILIARLLDASREVVLSLAPKSATAPVAMAIAGEIGGIPALAAVLAVLTGITGAVLGGWVLDLVRVRDPGTRGFAVGLTSHGIGTARMLQVDSTAGAFAGAAMGVNALLTALLLPLLFGAF